MINWWSDLAGAGAGAPKAGAVTEPEGVSRRRVVRQALRLRREAELFSRRWPPPLTPDAQVPPICWSQLERQLADLSGSPVRAGLACDLISATRKTSVFKPPEMVWREIFCLAWALLDEGFPADCPADPGATLSPL